MVPFTLLSACRVKVHEPRATPAVEQAPLKTAVRPPPTVSRTEEPTA